MIQNLKFFILGFKKSDPDYKSLGGDGELGRSIFLSDYHSCKSDLTDVMVEKIISIFIILLTYWHYVISMYYIWENADNMKIVFLDKLSSPSHLLECFYLFPPSCRSGTTTSCAGTRRSMAVWARSTCPRRSSGCRISSSTTSEWPVLMEDTFLPRVVYCVVCSVMCCIHW